jgi:hypothetical protein
MPGNFFDTNILVSLASEDAAKNAVRLNRINRP